MVSERAALAVRRLWLMLDNVKIGLCKITKPSTTEEMVTRNPTHPISTVSEPLWKNEKRIPVRAVWEIAALAGNVRPSLGNVKHQKAQSSAWKAAYNEIMRRMIDVLKPTTAQDINHINYDPTLPINASIQGQSQKHRQLRVDVLSACNFLANRYGIENLPEGMRLMLPSLESDAARNSAQLSSTIAQTEGLKKSTEGKDQTKANETKKSIVLSTVLVAMAIDLWSRVDVEEESRALEDQITDLLANHRLTHLRGLKPAFVLDAIRAGKKYIQQKKA